MMDDLTFYNTKLFLLLFPAKHKLYTSILILVLDEFHTVLVVHINYGENSDRLHFHLNSTIMHFNCY